MRLVRFGSLLVPGLVSLSMGCGTSLRGGARSVWIGDEPVVSGDVTAVGGLADDDAELLLGVLLAGGVGSSVDTGEAIGHLESGLELDRRIVGPLGFRSSVRAGGYFGSTSASYLGMRGGPRLALGEARSDTWVPSLNLEGIAAAPLEGDPDERPVFGLALSLGVDYLAAFSMRMPSGRPLRSARGEPLLRALVRTAHGMPEVRLDLGLGAEVRDALGAAWLEDARLEDASVGSFELLASELAGLGAPPDLVRRARRAAHDERLHAELCCSMGSALLGVRWEPAPERPFTLARELPRSTWVALALDSLVDGCVGEGLAARLASLRACRASDPTTRAVLARIAEDEARHAELALAIVAYAVAVDPRSRVAICRALRSLETLPCPEVGLWPSTRSHGGFDRGDIVAAHEATIERVLRRVHRLPRAGNRGSGLRAAA